MDAERFDRLSKNLATGVSRRRILRGLARSAAGGAAVVGLAAVGHGTALAKGAGSGGSTCNAYCSQEAGPGRGVAFAQCAQFCRQCGGPQNILYNCQLNQNVCLSATCQPSIACPGTCFGTCCTEP